MNSAWSQPGGNRPAIGLLSGTVIDAISEKPIEFATITLFSRRDSSIVTGGVTNQKGYFLIEEIPAGMYRANITFIGYDVYVANDLRFMPGQQVNQDLGSIALQPSVAALDAAEVVEERPVMELLMDKRVFNVDELISAQGASATELMETLPSVEVDVDGNISLRGSQNVTVLIDGKPSALTGASRQALLEQIPASSIERIEVITNPSAKYDPDGMTGIINIVLKKNKLQGFHGNLSLSAGTGDQYNGSFGLNYRDKKVNVFTNYSYRYADRFSRSTTDRTSYLEEGDLFLDQNSEGNSIRSNHTIKAGTDIYLTPSSTLGFSVTYNTNESEGLDSLFNDQYYVSGVPLSYYRRDSRSEDQGRGYDLAANFRKDFDGNDHFLTADVQWSDFSGSAQNDITNSDLDQDGIIINPFNEQEVNRIEDGSQVLTLQLDYARPLHGGQGKIETGYKSIVRDLNNLFDGESLDSISGDFVAQVDRNNVFEYSEGIHALYAQYGRKLDRLSFQGGLRAEQVYTTSLLKTTDEQFENDYFSLFPSAYLTYALSKENEVQFSYSRRINRPRSRQLNPFPNYSDNLNLQRGNPFLLPEYTNSFEATYSLRRKASQVMISAYLQDQNEVIRRYTTIDSLGVRTTTYANYAGMQNYGLELVMNMKLTKWWSLNMSANGYRTVNDATNLESDLSSTAYSWSARAMSNMKFNSGWQLQIMGFYRAPEIFPQGEFLGFVFTNISVKKSILDDKGTLTLNLRDAFDTREFKFNSFGSGFDQESYRKRESRNLFLTFTYRFGKLEAGRDRRRSGGGGDDDGGGFDDMMD